MVEEVAGKLQADIGAGTETVLPSMDRLARRYGVSASTLVKAARLLRARGVLRFSQGQRLHVAGRQVAEREPSGATARIAGWIRERIAGHAYRTGTPLPKRDLFSHELAVSPASVTKACKALAREGVLHKHGRQWMVGPRSKAKTVSITDRPKMLLIQKRDHQWQALASQEPTNSFCEAFAHEVHHHDIDLVPVLVEGSETPPGFLCTGLEDTVALVKRLGSRYLGALLLTQALDSRQLQEWCAMLLKFKKPVVCFDERYIRPEIPLSNPLLARSSSSVRKVCRLALAHLARLGHRKIRFVCDYTESRHHDLRFLFEALAPEFPGFEIGLPGAPSDRSKAAGARRVLEPAAMAEIFAGFAPPRPGKAFPGSRAAPDSSRKLAPVFRHLSLQAVEILRSMSWFMRQMRMEVPGLAEEFSLALSASEGSLPRGLKTFLGFLADDRIAKRIRLNHHRLTHPSASFLEALASPGVTAMIASNDLEAKYISCWLKSAGIAIPERMSVLSLGHRSDFVVFPVTTIDWRLSLLGYNAFHRILGHGSARRQAGSQIAAAPEIRDRGSVGPPPRL